MSERKGLNRQLFWLYQGQGTGPYVFRWALLVAYFLLVPFNAHTGWLQWLDYVIGAIITLDLAARFYIAKSKRKFFTQIMTWADIVIVITMFAPLLIQNLAFLRMLRAVRAIRAFTFIRRAGGVMPWFKNNEKIIDRVTNLVVFVLVMSAMVYVLQYNPAPDAQINDYVDAVYFTVTTLTTTGYGDILMQDTPGRLLAIVIMVMGLTLFLRLVRAIVRPTDKVEQECETCGLLLHDPDAVHCKHCGATIKIQTRGLT
jgi:voltage-gated potassium channel